jgi:hypothetical protein
MDVNLGEFGKIGNGGVGILGVKDFAGVYLGFRSIRLWRLRLDLARGWLDERKARMGMRVRMRARVSGSAAAHQP